MIYQFTITLVGTRPPVWRRVQVSDTFTFADFHNVIQDSMGWYDCHLHSFEMADPKNSNQSLKKVEINMNDEEAVFGHMQGVESLDENCTKISDYFTLEKCNLPGHAKDTFAKANYKYDFGDKWSHKIKLETFFELVEGEDINDYPKCIAGQMACPPEDCGGSYGYEDLKVIMADAKHAEHEQMKKWILESRMGAGPWDPYHFDSTLVKLYNPIP